MIEPEIFRGEMKSFEVQHIKVDGKHSRLVIVRLYNNENLIELAFKGILDTRDISFSLFGEMMVQVSNLSDKGWDGQTIYVEELFEHSFSFFCDEFSSNIKGDTEEALKRGKPTHYKYKYGPGGRTGGVINLGGEFKDPKSGRDS